MTHINLAGLEVGQSIGSIEILLTRDSLVRYAGASGDFNPIHYRDDIAAAVGLPGVLAHGMLTMGAAIQVSVWLTFKTNGKCAAGLPRKHHIKRHSAATLGQVSAVAQRNDLRSEVSHGDQALANNQSCNSFTECAMNRGFKGSN